LALYVASFDRISIGLWAQRSLGATVAAILAFIIATPGYLHNSQQFFRDFSYEVRHASTGHGLLFEGLPSGFLVQSFHLVVGLGFIVLPMALAGLVWSAGHRERGALAIGAFTLIFFILIGSAEVLFSRYTFPLYFGLAFGFGLFIDLCRPFRIIRHAAPVAGILGVGGLALVCARWTGYMDSDDPRKAVADALRSKAEVQDFTVGLVSDPWFYTPLFYRTTSAPRFIEFYERHERMRMSRRPLVVRYVPEPQRDRFDWDVRLITDLKPDRIVYSSFESGDVHRLSNLSQPPSHVKLFVDRYSEFQKRLAAEYDLELDTAESLAGVHDLEYIRPRIWVWKKKARS
jgi:hypothetical protein